jgi:uncharacterized membrane protein YgcG
VKKMKRALTICGTVAATVLIAGQAAVNAQAPAAPATAAPATAAPAANKTPPFKQEELEAIVAPIALYPDALLAQIFMAATYPLEIVEAARWSKANSSITGDAVAGAVQSQTWDPSVKSLCAFPTVLANMNEKIDWTQKMGDAFLAQQKEVMQAVQVLRGKAKETGNLKSSKEVTVKEEAAPAGSPAPQTIIIESPDPEVLQVPVYNTSVVYGSWGYPYYPPYSYYPPGYAYGAAFWSFTAGVVVGGAIWGNCNWGGNDINIDIDRQNNFNRNEINHNRNNNNRGNSANTNNRGGNKQSWQHNAEHRKGVGYKDSATQQKFGKGASQRDTQAREQYRGRAEQGRQQISREGAANQRDLGGNSIGSRDNSARSGAGTRDLGGASARDLGGGTTRDLGGGTRDLGGASTRDLGGGTRDLGGSSRDFGGSSNRSSSRSSSAFGGSNRSSGASTRMSSSRGGMSRGGGGMSRGGGGRRR